MPYRALAVAPPRAAAEMVPAATIMWAPQQDWVHVSGQRSAVAAALVELGQKRTPVLVMRVAMWLCVPAALVFTLAAWVPRLLGLGLDRLAATVAMLVLWAGVAILAQRLRTLEQRWREHASIRLASALLPDVPALDGSTIAAHITLGSYSDEMADRLRLSSWCASQLELVFTARAAFEANVTRRQVTERFRRRDRYNNNTSYYERRVWRTSIDQRLHHEVEVCLTPHDASAEPWLAHICAGVAGEGDSALAFVHQGSLAFVRQGSSALALVLQETSRWSRGVGLSDPQLARCRRVLQRVRQLAPRGGSS